MQTKKRQARGISTNPKNMPQERTGRAVRRAYSGIKLERALTGRYGQLPVRKWARLISKDAGVSLTHGTLARALEGTPPVRPELRLALGYPALVSTPVCATCGIVHVSTRCPTTRKASKPRVGPTRRQTRWLQVAGMLWGGDGPSRPRPATSSNGR